MLQNKVFKKRNDMTEMPLRKTCLRQGLHAAVFVTEGLYQGKGAISDPYIS